MPTVRRFLRPLQWPTLLLGMALGGFFSGALLQIIQKSQHQLFGVGTAKHGVQFFADGVFHGMMAMTAVIALCMLWKRRHLLTLPGAGTALWAHASIGFGGWHLLDALLSHGIADIYGLSMDTDPLGGDLVLFSLCVVPLVMGLLALRNYDGAGHASGRRAAAAISLAVLLAGTMASMPPELNTQSSQVMVVFTPAGV